jgi:large subunit ribosomal protein L10
LVQASFAAGTVLNRMDRIPGVDLYFIEGVRQLERKDKETFVSDMKLLLQRAQATFVVDYQGIDVETMNSLRRDLRKVNADFHVVKNRLLKLASDETQTACIKEHLVGPCALAITYEDVVGTAKLLVEKDKKLEKLKLKIGQVGGKAIDVGQIKRLSELPGKEVLLSQLLSAMQGVPTSLVRALNGVVLNLLYVLKSIETQKSES